MSHSQKRPRNAVSFTSFRRMQLLAIKRLWSYLWTSDDVVNAETHFFIWGLVTSLEESRFADAVALARQLSEQQYGEHRTFRLVAQIIALVKKVPFSDPSLDPEAKAMQKFLQAEADCREINAVMRDFRLFHEGVAGLGSERHEDSTLMCDLILRARKHIASALGRKPDVPAMLQMGRFGSGSSVGVHGNATHFLRKMSVEKWTVSPLCLPFATAACAATPAFWYALGLEPSQAEHLTDEMLHYFESGKRTPFTQEDLLTEFREAFMARIELTGHDLITYVPKDADCHRTVGTQPLLNVFCQLGVGDYLQDVLRDKCGIDLETGQEEVNGPLAFLASDCDGLTLATIDLASASDTISKELVKTLLPRDWYELLNALRTPNYLIGNDEEPRPYEKFCAMGNGFCFPLETIIFWSLAQAVYDVTETPDRLMAVYGDDIIVYQSAALLLIELLDACGFQTNTSKTFVHGPFRESCGQDFFNGINVRPVVLDEVIEGLGQAYHLINSLQRKGYTKLAQEMRGLLPTDELHMRPYPGDTTTALEVPMDEFMASRHARFQKESSDDPSVPFFCSWSWVELLPTAVNDEAVYDERTHLSAALQGATSNGGAPVYAFRRKTRVRVRRVAHG